MMKFKSLFRRGPTQASGGKGLKGAPSVSSLDSKHGPAKPHKLFGSKEKLTKGHKRGKAGYGWNNNSVAEEEGGGVSGGVEEEEYGSAEEVRCDDMQHECVSLPVNLNADLRLHNVSEAELIASSVQELETLRRELEAAARDKAALLARVDHLERRAAEADQLRAQLDNIKALEQQRLASLERLADENGVLRARLRGVAHSPLSDNEKRQLLLQPPPHPTRMHWSAPASIALASTAEGDVGDAAAPDWDKHSSSSLSEVSVACLQDRILQMEENHYSTSEELQATLAELADLQSALSEAQADNERLADEKQVLLESLCRQTEKLEDSRSKVDTLQEMLLRDGEPEQHMHASQTDGEQQGLVLLKIAQDERRLLQSKQEQLAVELSDARTNADDKSKECERLTERVRSLEGVAERAESERAQWEREAAAARDAASSRQMQLATLTQLLDQAKTKLSSLEEALASRAAGAEAAAAAEAAEARRDADTAAARAHQLAERLAHAQRQLERAHTDARKLHDDHLVSRNNAESTISELQFQAERLRQEKAAVQSELAALQDAHAQLQVQCQVLSEEKMAVMGRATEALSHSAEMERQLQDARNRYAQLARDRERDETEWQQFQSDLLMTVRVANDFKTEAQKELERLVSENKTAREKIRALEDQIHNMKALPTRSEESPAPPPLLTSASLQDIMATATSHRRTKGVSRQDSRLSVKSLIESIENAAKVAKQQAAVTAAATPTTAQTPTEWPQPSLSVSSSSSSSLKNGLDLSPPPAAALGKPPPAARTARNIMLTSEGGGAASSAPSQSSSNMPDEQRQALASALQQKAIESFVRRNSYGDICERKDPLNALQVKNGGSKRNALLKWCQQKTMGYKNIDITNFSSSWNDGLALCALLHSYLGAERIPYDALTPQDKRTNFAVAFAAAEAVGVPTTLNIQDMIQQERPDWQQVMAYVTSIYKHFET